MPEVRNGGLLVIYRAGVIVLFVFLCFIGARIYSTVEMLPKEYVSMERYKCDMDRLEAAMNRGFSEVKTEIRGLKP